MQNQKTIIETKQNMLLGVLFTIAASFCIAVMGVFVKLIGDGQSTNTVAFARFFCGLIILLPWFLSEKELLKVDNMMQIIYRSLTTLGAMICVFIALKYLSITNVMLLSNTFPLFVPILALVFLKVKTPLKLWVAIAIGFTGVTLILQPTAAAFNIMMLVALFSGFLSACAILQIRLLTKTTSTKKILFYFFLCCSILTGLFLPFGFKQPTTQQLLLLLLVGISGSLSQVFMTLAVKYTIARVVSVIYFSSIIFAGIFDWLVWRHTPSLLEYIGILIVLAGGIATVLISSSSEPNIIRTENKIQLELK